MKPQATEDVEWHAPLTTRRQRKTQKRRWTRERCERTPGFGSVGIGAHFLWHFCRWAMTHGAKCKKHVWVCPRCYDCLACLHVEECECGYFHVAPGARTVVVASLPGFATGG